MQGLRGLIIPLSSCIRIEIWLEPPPTSTFRLILSTSFIILKTTFLWKSLHLPTYYFSMLVLTSIAKCPMVWHLQILYILVKHSTKGSSSTFISRFKAGVNVRACDVCIRIHRFTPKMTPFHQRGAMNRQWYSFITKCWNIRQY